MLTALGQVSVVPVKFAKYCFHYTRGTFICIYIMVYGFLCGSGTLGIIALGGATGSYSVKEVESFQEFS